MKDFERLIDLIKDEILDEEDSMRIDYNSRPPSALFHTFLDGKEFTIIIAPTDLEQ